MGRRDSNHGLTELKATTAQAQSVSSSPEYTEQLIECAERAVKDNANGEYVASKRVGSLAQRITAHTDTINMGPKVIVPIPADRTDLDIEITHNGANRSGNGPEDRSLQTRYGINMRPNPDGTLNTVKQDGTRYADGSLDSPHNKAVAENIAQSITNCMSKNALPRP